MCFEYVVSRKSRARSIRTNICSLMSNRWHLKRISNDANKKFFIFCLTWSLSFYLFRIFVDSLCHTNTYMNAVLMPKTNVHTQIKHTEISDKKQQTNDRMDSIPKTQLKRESITGLTRWVRSANGVFARSSHNRRVFSCADLESFVWV